MLGLRKTLSTGDIESTSDDTIHSILQNITAGDMDALLALETQARMDHQERIKQQEIKPTTSRIKFDLPSPPPRPKSPDLTMKRRWSLPIGNKKKSRWSRLFSQKQDSLVIALGSRVKLYKRPLPLIGTVKYIGQVHFDTGEWLGIELDYRVGNTDGTFDGIRYFKTNYQQGLFVRKQDTILL